MKFLISPLFNDNRKNFWHIILGVWSVIAVYAVLHDLYIVHIYPEHFTLYHTNPLKIKNPIILSSLWAFGASFTPGFSLGLALFLASRVGSLPKVNPSFIIKGAIVAVIVTEILSVFSGIWVWLFRKPFYPEIVYPEKLVQAMVAQTIQLSTYFVGAFSGFIFICLVLIKRKKMLTSRSTMYPKGILPSNVEEFQLTRQ